MYTHTLTIPYARPHVQDGGGVQIEKAGILTISNGTIESCTARANGGAAYISSSELSFEYASFTNNTAGSGSALYFESRGKNFLTETHIRSVTLYNNSGSVLVINAPTTWQCRAGLWMPLTGSFSGDISNCTEQCQAGSFGLTSNLTTPTCSGPCLLGHFCDAGTIVPTPCPVGTRMPGVGPPGSIYCLPCAPGEFQRHSGETACEKCAAGTFSPAIQSPECNQCRPGGYCEAEGRDILLIFIYLDTCMHIYMHLYMCVYLSIYLYIYSPVLLRRRSLDPAQRRQRRMRTQRRHL